MERGVKCSVSNTHNATSTKYCISGIFHGDLAVW